MLTNKEMGFLARRRSACRAFPWIGIVALVAWAGVLAHLYLNVPLLANPKYVMSAIAEGRIPQPTLRLGAAMLPVVFLMLLLLLVVPYVMALAWSVYEKRYLAIIDKLRWAEQSQEDPSAE